MITKQERLFSLNGSFEAMDKMMQAILSEKLTSMDEAKLFIISNMKYLNGQMCELEKELRIN